MNTYRPSQTSSIWLVALKILLLILCLYISAVILGKIFTLLFAVTFFIIRLAIIVVAAFLVLHFFLKLLFQIDLLQIIFGRRFSLRR